MSSASGEGTVSEEGYILSPQQRRWWRLGSRFRIRATFDIEAERPEALGTQALARAVAGLAAEYEIFRTDLRAADGIPVQIIGEAPRLVFSAAPTEHGAGEDIDTLSRIFLETTSAGAVRLTFSLSAFHADPETTQIVAEALCRHLAGEAVPAGFVQYADYAQWQQDMAASQEAAAGRAFWRERFDPRSLKEKVPLARCASRENEFDLKTIPLALSGDVRLVATGLNVSAEVVLAACWLVALARLTGQGAPTVGYACSARGFPELERAPGPMTITIPLSSEMRPELPFADFARDVARAMESARQHADAFAATAEPSVSPPVFPFGFSFYEARPVRGNGMSMQLVGLDVSAYLFQVALSCVAGETGLHAALSFDAAQIDVSAATAYADLFRHILTNALSDTGCALGDLGRLRAEERTHDQPIFGPAPAEGPRLHDLFRAAAARAPHRVAIVCEGESLTYRALDAQSNRWARHLRNMGAGPDRPVIIAVERSVRLPVFILAVLKAGAAYVPVEPRSPPERLRRIAATAGAGLLLTSDAESTEMLPQDVRRLAVDEEWEAVSNLDDAPLDCPGGAGDLAYLVFTSGSTGEPKAVAVEHRQIVNYVDGVCARLALSECESFAHVSSIAADLGNTVLFPALLHGRTLVLAGHGEMLDPIALSSRFAGEGGIDCLKIAPSHLKALFDGKAEPRALLPRKMLVLGGERFDWDFAEELRRLSPNCRIANHYGPTEATVGALVHELPQNWAATPSGSVPLGTPLPKVGAFVLDDARRPVRIGVVGELYLCGAGLARGYHRDPQRTSAAFCDVAPFGAGPVRTYRTGDLVRRLPDGAIEFLGRRDRQVKLHGFRIELEEIEAAAISHEAVRAAAALLRDVARGRQGIVLYVSGPGGSAAALRSHLERRLPAQMMPARIVALPALPLTPNGKRDSAALMDLPLPDEAAGGGEAPRNPAERRLAEIWADVMALPFVGIHDDFFLLGGDSILGIQIVARAGEGGLTFTPLELFELRTIAKLAAIARSRRPAAIEQGPVAGAVPLTPIQHWFFEGEPPEPWHCNLSLLLECDERVDQGLLARALDRTVAHHDALRMRFERTAESWVQHNTAEVVPVPMEHVDLSALNDEQTRAAIAIIARRTQASLDIAVPPLLRAVLFDTRGGSRILFVVHHLVMDAVSWRPFLDTVSTVYDALKRDIPLLLPAKTTSFKRWSEMLSADTRADAQVEYWRAQAAPSDRLPVDFADGRNTQDCAETFDVALDAETTRKLLRDVPVAYQTRIDDALLTALARSVLAWAGRSELWVELEGHGRASPSDDVDCGRTVGWFTARWPQRLSVARDAGVGAALRAVKEQLRAVPDGGIGYGVLRYLRRAPDLAGGEAPDISFNYLGQVDHAFPVLSGWRVVPEFQEGERSGKQTRRQRLAVDAMVRDGRLQLRWTYSRECHRASTIARLAESFCAEIGALVDHCATVLRGHYTASDFPLAKLRDEELQAVLLRYGRDDADTLSALQQLVTLHYLWEGAADESHRRALRKLAVEDIYALSPMQQGLLFDVLYAQDGSLYKVQKLFTLEGALTPSVLRRAWELLVSRHPSLRTVFVWKDVAAPVQVVLGAVDVPWVEWDWSGLSANEREAAVAAFLQEDWAEDIALDRGPVMRLALAKLSPDRHLLIWTHHHLLLDGWCNSLLLREVLDQAQALRKGDMLLLPRGTPYRDYIAWLSARGSGDDETWWRGTLGGAVLPTPLVFERDTPAPVARRNAHLALAASREDKARLQRVSAELGVTLGAVLNASWALLLSLYSGESDVVFGITTAGRPAELPGVESIVGLMMNVLPLRLQIDSDLLLADWLRQVQTEQSQLLAHQFTSLAQIRRWAGLRPGRPLFESHLSFENYPVDADLLNPSRPLHISSVRSFYSTTYPLSITIEPEDGLQIDVTYDPSRFDETVLAVVLAQWRELLGSFPLNLNKPLRALALGAIDDVHPLRAAVAAGDQPYDASHP